MDWEYSSPLTNALLSTNVGTGIKSSTFFDPLYTDFEPITNRNFQTTSNYISPNLGRLSNSYLTSDILLNTTVPNTSAPLLTQAYNSNYNSRSNYTSPYVPTQFSQQQLVSKNGVNNNNNNNKKGDLNININVENPDDNRYPNSILEQQHQYMLQKQAAQNQYFNKQKQLKGGLGNQQFQNQQQNYSNNKNNNNDDDYNDMESFQKKSQQILFSNRTAPNDNNDLHRRQKNAGEDNSITSTDADPLESASPLTRRNKNNNLHEKLYQEAFDNSGNFLFF
jgi:hypothetical protein